MIELKNNSNILEVKSSFPQIVYFDYENANVKMGEYEIDSPGEYEKSWILCEVFEKDEKLFYRFIIEEKVIAWVLYDNISEIQEEVIGFLWDVDILLIIGSKASAKFIENIEARVVVPLSEGKEVFFNQLWQKKEEMTVFKLRQDMGEEQIEFVNLA